jgi:hypothetical protein
VIQFRATGGSRDGLVVPILKIKKVKVRAGERIHTVASFLRAQLGGRFPADHALFLYVNGTFSPGPDATIGDLCRCFGVKGELEINYAVTPAWG